MAKHKVSELEGALLDAAVAKAEGWTVWNENFCGRGICYATGDETAPTRMHFHPATQWADAGPLIERERIMLEPPWSPNAGGNGVWVAWTEFDRTGGRGDSPLIAAMRAYLANKFGDEVELP